MIKLVLTIALICFSLCIQSSIKAKHIYLNDDWELQILRDARKQQSLQGKKFKTSLPTNLHLDLLRHNKIGDPYLDSNHQQLSWISECLIKYTKVFQFKEDIWGGCTQIIFNGIDTFANVTINGQLVIKASNAHRKYKARIDNFLIKGKQNKIQVIISPTSNYQLENTNIDHNYSQIRKPMIQYGSQWSPKILTLGIWRAVQLHYYHSFAIDYVWVRNKIVSQKQAVLNFAFKILSNFYKNQPKYSNIYIQIYLNKTKISQTTVQDSEVYTNVIIDKPKLWWPNGIGQAHLYNFTVYLVKDEQTIDQKSIIYGIRTVQLNMKQQNYQLKINSKSIYMRGADYVPLDILFPRTQNKQIIQTLLSKQTKISQYSKQKLLSDAVQSNFNTIRILGVGNYESQQFLLQASIKGIMILYDFMFYQSTYPAQFQFLENVEQQVKQQIRLTRNYPAVVLWRGNDLVQNNKIKYNLVQKKNSQKLFDGLIKRVVSIQNVFVPFIKSSQLQKNKNGQNSKTNADDQKNTRSRMNALPSIQTVKKFFNNQKQEITYDSKFLIAHQTQNDTLSQIKIRIQNQFRNTSHFKYWIYLSNILQAQEIQKLIKSYRGSKQNRFGCFYSSINEPWPSISSATIDYYGRWKAAQYVAKRFYSNIAIFTLQNNSLEVVVMNDNLYSVQVLAKLLIIKLNGTVIHQEQRSIYLNGNQIKNVFKIQPSLIKNQQKQIMSYTQVFYNRTLQMRSSCFYSMPKDLNLLKAKLSIVLHQSDGYFLISSDRVIRYLFINSKTHSLQFNDNYFDVVPGYPILIKFTYKSRSKVGFRTETQFWSLRETSLQDDLLQVSYSE